MRLSAIDIRVVARVGLKAMLQGRPSRIVGVMNAILAWISTRAPRRLVTTLTGCIVRL